MAPSRPAGAMMAKRKVKIEDKESGPSPEDVLESQLRDASATAKSGNVSLPKFERQFRPLSFRKFCLDFACPSLRFGVEVDGGIWSRGAHIRPAGREYDMLRDATLMLHGWKVFRFSSKHVRSGLAIKIITAYIQNLTCSLSDDELHALEAEIKNASSKRKKNVTRRAGHKTRKTEKQPVAVKRNNRRSPRSPE